MIPDNGNATNSTSPWIDSNLGALPAKLGSASDVFDMVHLLRLPVFCIGCDTERVWEPSELCAMSFQPDTDLDRGVAALVCVACTEDPQLRMRAMRAMRAEWQSYLDRKLA